MKNTGKAYEELTEQVFRRLLTQKNLVADVQRDVHIQGRSTKHQIDVTFEFTAGPISYRTILQCKDWTSAVKQEQVLAFNSVLADIPGQPRGIIVSRSGFQEGARNVAEHHGIKLYELREPRDEDWDGLIREVVIDIHFRQPKFENFRPILDVASIRTQLDALGLGKVSFDVQGNPDRLFVKVPSGEQVNINKLLNSLVPENGVGPFHLRYDFTESIVMLTPGSPLTQLPVLAFEATAKVSEFHQNVRVSVDHLIAYSFKDVLTGKVDFLRKDGGMLDESDEGGQS
jgi:hypothetical protein